MNHARKDKKTEKFEGETLTLKQMIRIKDLKVEIKIKEKKEIKSSEMTISLVIDVQNPANTITQHANDS